MTDRPDIPAIKAAAQAAVDAEKKLDATDEAHRDRDDVWRAWRKAMPEFQHTATPSTILHLCAIVEAQARKIEGLREALKFYSGPYAPYDEEIIVKDFPDGSSRSKLIQFGERARSALEQP